MNVERQERATLRCRTEARALKVEFSGPVNECFEPETELAAMAPFLEKKPSRVVFDLSGIERINSAGVRHWINFLRIIEEHYRISFSVVSEAIIELAAISPFVLGKPPAEIETFQIPYVCEDCSQRFHVLGQSSQAGPGGTWPAMDVRHSCPNCRGEAVIDVGESSYFEFLKLLQPT